MGTDKYQNVFLKKETFLLLIIEETYYVSWTKNKLVPPSFSYSLGKVILDNKQITTLSLLWHFKWKKK